MQPLIKILNVLEPAIEEEEDEYSRDDKHHHQHEIVDLGDTLGAKHLAQPLCTLLTTAHTAAPCPS